MRVSRGRSRERERGAHRVGRYTHVILHSFRGERWRERERVRERARRGERGGGGGGRGGEERE